MARNYERSPRQRTEWFGGQAGFALETNDQDVGFASGQTLLNHKPRISLSTGTVDKMAFPAGILRGESCSIARFAGNLTIFDTGRRQQNVSYVTGAGLIKTEVEDDAIADPISTGGIVSAPDALNDLQASWLWHRQLTWNPKATGSRYETYSLDWDIDTTNSRIFESNDVMQLSVQVQTLANLGSEPINLDLRVYLVWRCLLRLD